MAKASGRKGIQMLFDIVSFGEGSLTEKMEDGSQIHSVDACKTNNTLIHAFFEQAQFPLGCDGIGYDAAFARVWGRLAVDIQNGGDQGADHTSEAE